MQSKVQKVYSKDQKQDNIDVHFGLLLMRNTHRDNSLKSPARKITVPKNQHSFTYNWHFPQTLKSYVMFLMLLKKVRLQKKTYYDKNASSQSQLHPGKTVRIHKDKLDRQWMGCISEWGATVNGNVCVSGIHDCAFNRFDAC